MEDQKGFTLIEVLVVLAIVTSVYLFSSFVLSQRQPQVSLDMASSDLLSVLRMAQSQSVASRASSSWGVYFSEGSNSSYVLYAGENYTDRNLVYDQAYEMGEGLSWQLESESNDLNFSRNSGLVNATATIEIMHSSITDKGIIDINQIAKIERND